MKYRDAEASRQAIEQRLKAMRFRRLAVELGVSGELAAGHRNAAALLDPILSGEVTSGAWASPCTAKSAGPYAIVS